MKMNRKKEEKVEEKPDIDLTQETFCRKYNINRKINLFTKLVYFQENEEFLKAIFFQKKKKNMI